MRIVNSIFSIVFCLAKLLYFNDILYFVFILFVCLLNRSSILFTLSVLARFVSSWQKGMIKLK